jgi:hypothetical protein
MKDEQTFLFDDDCLEQENLRKLEAALRCRAQVRRYVGNEEIHYEGESSSVSVLDFWRWARSDLVTNTERGAFAEFLVADALEVPLTGVREAWSTIDLTTPEGITVQVRSAAYVQSWYQKCFSSVKFSIKPKRAWNPEADTRLDTVARRHLDVYVFALLKHMDKASIDPLNLAQWEFYVLPTAFLNTYPGDQILLKELQTLTTDLWHHELREAVLAVGQGTTTPSKKSRGLREHH